LTSLILVMWSAISMVAPTFVLAENGSPRAVIVVRTSALAASPEGPDAKVAAAAADLREYVAKLSGAKLEIVGDENPPSGPLILVGRSRQTEKLKLTIPSGVTAQANEEGYLLETRGDRLVLAGNDDGPYHGTEYAVSDLLHRLGVRWYMPGEYGEYVPSAPTLSVAAVKAVCRPDFRLRNWWLHTTPEMLALERKWKIRNRMNPDTPIAIPGDSSVRDFVPDAALARTRPELFARNPDGTPNTTLPCLTNPEALKIAAEKMKAFFRAGALSKGIAPDDGFPRDFTPSTRALNQNFVQLGGREGEPTEVSTSEEWFAFINALAAEVKKEFPDRVIVTNGYANRDLPPHGIAIDPNISVMYAAIWCDGLHAYDDPKSWQTVRQGLNLRRWARMCDKVWVYNYDDVMLVSGLTPLPITRKLARDLPLLKKWGVIGFHSESRNVWMECGIPTRYLRARLEWDTGADVKAILDEFYARWYGAAAEPARRFWETIEDAIESSTFPGHEDRILPYVYGPNLVDSLRPLIEAAESCPTDDRSRLHVRTDRLIFEHLAAYMRVHQAEWAGRWADAARECERMMECRKELHAICPFYCLPDEQRYNSGVWYWAMLDRAAYYRKLAEMTSGKTGDLIALLPEATLFRTDPTDLGRFAGWYEPDFDASGWQTVRTTMPFYAQGHMSAEGYPYTGVVWYRFAVDVPKKAAGRKVILFAPALETEAWAWVNGKYVGHRPYKEAYERPSELSLDVTDALQPGKRNVIALRVHTSLNPAVAAGGLVSRAMLYAPKP